MVAVTIYNACGAVVDAQFVMLQFVLPEGCHRRLSLIRFAQDDKNSVNLLTKERALPPSVQLLNPEEALSLQEGQDHTLLTLQLIIGKESEDDNNNEHEDALHYKGFVLRNCFGRVLFTELFSEDLTASMADNAVKLRCFRCSCFTLDDIKRNSTLMGQGTATVMCPCTICVSPKKDFAFYLMKPRDEQPLND
ncbi:hypothetical protein SEMRO_3190_G344930.1 [Seminavis robusta]|uniref:Uncharacterized protein n=1 Tax=Seminavis robusta TaxID=568900 RepID=A0A9N8F2X5_9STRA|nr:hypothetical protein SEMRO_3190_G344930.1 [Seminavis robusta]|eukprot:Sro3190_g344930.1 n/a (193) ;mRNA; f:1011-1589